MAAVSHRRRHHHTRAPLSSTPQPPPPSATVTAARRPPLPRKMDFAVASSEPELDFDDAWYGVRLSLHGNTMFVHYSDLAEAHVDYFRAADFGSLPTSKTAIAGRCWRPGRSAPVTVSAKTMSASMTPMWRWLSFVATKCLMEASKWASVASLLWRHGPNRRRKTWTCIEEICLIQDGHVLAGAILHDFLKLAVKKIECNNGGFEDKGIKLEAFSCMVNFLYVLKDERGLFS